MTVNAGHSASLGAEASIRATITNAFSLNAAYGYTHATFKDYVSNQKNQAGELVSVNYNGNYIPMVPQNTFSLGAEYGIFIERRSSSINCALLTICGALLFTAPEIPEADIRN